MLLLMCQDAVFAFLDARRRYFPVVFAISCYLVASALWQVAPISPLERTRMLPLLPDILWSSWLLRWLQGKAICTGPHDCVRELID